MSVDVIMPALGMAQETGKIVRWLKSPGDIVKKGEPLIEVETDKAIAEIESPGDGILSNVTANEGEVVPVATVIALILAPGESEVAAQPVAPGGLDEQVSASPLARRIAQENSLDLRLIRPKGNKIEKADVYAYLEKQKSTIQPSSEGIRLASPKARRLMKEFEISPAQVRGSGPGGAILATDLQTFIARATDQTESATVSAVEHLEQVASPVEQTASFSTIGTTWRIMSERTTLSWQSAPHFYLMREVNASRFVQWYDDARRGATSKITFTDLLVRVTAQALRRHPRVNASWRDGQIAIFGDIHIGLAVAVEEGLVVPVIRNADRKGLYELAADRERLVASAKEKSLRLEDIRDGTFTLSNLGMYQVDAFNAVINPPQAAILATGRITDRVVPVDGQVAIQPTMILSLSCDHRVIDGATGAKFLQTVAEMIEQPLKMLD